MANDIMEVSTNYQVLKQRVTILKQATEELLRPDLDYGAPFGGSDKPTLLKPGAEKLSFLFGLRPTFEIVDKIEDWESGLFYYRYRCTLHDRTGEVLADSEGSCNSREVKYRYRTAKPKCPKCGAEAISRSKYPPRGAPQGTPPGWWCRECRADFAVDDKAITDQETGKVENPEPFDLVNTLQKMAQKRALVAAVLVATGASQFFTQDIEDMAEFEPPTISKPQVVEAEVREVTESRKAAPKPQAPPPAYGPDYEDGSDGQPARPYAPETLRAKIADRVKAHAGKSYGDKRDNFRFAVVGNLESCFGQHKDQARHLVTEWLLGKASSKKFTDPEIMALKDWLGARKIDVGEWVVNDISKTEAVAVYRQALKDAGQTDMFEDALPAYSEMSAKQLQDHVSDVLMPMIRERGLQIQGYEGMKPSTDWLATVWAALEIAPTIQV